MYTSIGFNRLHPADISRCQNLAPNWILRNYTFVKVYNKGAYVLYSSVFYNWIIFCLAPLDLIFSPLIYFNYDQLITTINSLFP